MSTPVMYRKDSGISVSSDSSHTLVEVDSASSVWTTAMKEYLTDSSLTKEEQQICQLRSPDDFISDLGSTTLTELQKSRLHHGMKRVQPFLKILEKFKGALDVFANADPHGVLACVWGSIRLVLVIAKDMTEFFEQLNGFVEDISDAMSRLTNYAALFQNNYRLNNSLEHLFVEVLQYFRWLRGYIGRPRKNIIRRLLIMHDLRESAQAQRAKLRHLCERTEKDAQLAAFEDAAEQQKQVLQIVQSAETLNVTEALRRSLQNIQRLIELVPMATALEDILDTTVEDTCTWLRTTPEILPLLTDSSNDTCTTTWIYGLPGCGKTYMAAYLTKLLQSKGPVGYFFCSKDERAVKDSAGVLRSWIWQLLQNHRSAAPDIENVLSNSTEVTKGTLKKALIMLLKNTSIPRCRLVLDGLDEYESKLRNDLLRTIEEIAPQVDIVILSRKEADIEKVMTSLSRIVHVERLEVTTEKTDADVLRFVQARVSNLDLEDDVVGQEIINTLHTRTQSMFLYAHLSIQELEGRDTDHERLQALRAMPSGIDAIYQRALTEIEKLSPARRDNIHKLCQLVLFAAKPVDVLEASVALAVRSGDAKLDPGNMISIKNLVTKFCSTFFAIHPKTGKISVVHETARAFLLSDSARRLQVQQQEAHNFILSACANFLALQSRGFVDRNISQDSDPDWNPFQHHASKHTFLEYASVCWFHHFLEVTGFWNIYLEKPVGAEESLRVSGLTMHTAEALTQFLASDTALIQWLEILHHFVCNGMPLASHVNDPLSDWIEYGQTKTITVGALLSADSQRNGEDMHPESIRLSLAFRLTSFISHLGRCNGHGIQRWLRWRNRERHIRPPIFIAASFNFDHFIKKQLDEGEDVNCRSVMDRTPLGLAAWMECHEAMEALIQRGADVSHCPAPDKITPLLESLSPLAFANLPRSYYRAAHILIEGGADVDNGLNPLQALIGGWTDMPEQFAILDAILDHSKDLRKLLETCDSRSGKHVLHLAAAKNEARLVKHLLERYPGTSCEYIDLPSAPGFDGKTALHEACYTRHSEVASILLDAGANPNIKAIQPVLAPIHIATRYRSDSLPLLLEHGADVDATDGVGSTTLHVAVDSDWLQGLEMLLQKGGQVNIINDQQETPLDAALRLKREDIVAALERKGARRACDVMKVHSWIMANVHIFNH